MVLDDCKSSCLSGHHTGMNSAKWVVGGDPTKPLAIVSSNIHSLVLDASTARWLGDPPLVAEPWDAKFFTNQVHLTMFATVYRRFG